jgi:hypothetical protein
MYNISSEIFSTTEEEWAENEQKDWMMCGPSQCSLLASDLSLRMKIVQENGASVVAFTKRNKGKIHVKNIKYCLELLREKL